jgi:hypothetical protein
MSPFGSPRTLPGDTLTLAGNSPLHSRRPSPQRAAPFWGFELDLRADELRKHGLRIRIQEQLFQVLTLLLGHSRRCAVAKLARAYVASGKRSEAVKLLNNLKKRSSLVSSHASEIAVIYAALGDTDQAMNWLGKGNEERFKTGVLLRPGFDPRRSDPRFQDLGRRIGLPR